MYKESITDIFFDLDHTLWDFERNSRLTFKKIFRAHKVGVMLEEFLHLYIPLNLAYWKMYRENRISKPDLRYQRLRKVFDSLNYDIEDELINTLSEEYITYLSSFNHLISNTTEVLEYLYPGYNLHIITNGFQEIQHKKLKNARIDHYFDIIVNSEMAGVKKPNPGIFRLALEEAKVGPEKALMIGDNLEADILGAQAVGIRAIHYNAHKEPAHGHCDMIDDLIEIKSYL
ncbi:MAG: YjjG family noncanonical pyrimidine nucleotidase [Flavobacteriaceae bacterium]|nr:YjjG family noncanonical pyrimidine nucleotidase [Flavobacteriaceae bacterium]